MGYTSCLMKHLAEKYFVLMCADRLNQRFVLLSEACIPLYPASFTYMQLLHESKSRVWVNPIAG